MARLTDEQRKAIFAQQKRRKRARTATAFKTLLTVVGMSAVVGIAGAYGGRFGGKALAKLFTKTKHTKATKAFYEAEAILQKASKRAIKTKAKAIKVQTKALKDVGQVWNIRKKSPYIGATAGVILGDIMGTSTALKISEPRLKQYREKYSPGLQEHIDEFKKIQHPTERKKKAFLRKSRLIVKASDKRLALNY